MRLPSPALVIASLALLLVTGGVAYGAASAARGGPPMPSNPFNMNALSFQDGFFTGQFPSSTTATLAITGFRLTNGANATYVTLYQFPQTGNGCSNTGGSRFVGQWALPGGQTVEEQLTTPIVLKPLTPGQPWCLGTFASGNTGNGLWINYNGYVVKGTFLSNAAAVTNPGTTNPTR